MEHYPVLMEEAVEYLSLKAGGVYVDATCGAGGHSKYILSKQKDIVLYGFDKDGEALKFAESVIGENEGFRPVNAGFETVADVMSREGIAHVDGFLFDLGFSTRQIKDAERGLSFMLEGPLDMRYDRSSELTASEIINFWDRASLIYVFEKYGEIKNPKKIVARIIERRKNQRFNSTGELAAFLADNFREKKKIHPATRFFMALRIAVNNELEVLRDGLFQASDLLSNNGRMVVISFHSLEDRIVKIFFRDSENLKVLTKRPVVASGRELFENQESRSAKLRACEKIEG